MPHCPYTLDFLPPSESVSSERYPRQYFQGFNNPSPRPIGFLFSVTTDPLRGHSHQAQHTSLALQLSHHSANTVAQQLRVLHNDQSTIGGNTGRLQDANAETLRGMSDEPGCSWAVKTLFWGSEDSSHIISYFTYCILVVLLSQKTKVIWISPTWFSHSKWLKPSNLPTFSYAGISQI